MGCSEPPPDLVNVVKTGNPHGEALPNWSQSEPTSPDLMMLTLDADAVMVAIPGRSAWIGWKGSRC